MTQYIYLDSKLLASLMQSYICFLPDWSGAEIKFTVHVALSNGSQTSFKVEKILKDSLDLIPSPLSSVKIQIMGGKVCLRCKGKTLLGIVNKLLKTKSVLTSPSNVLPNYPE